MKAIYQNLIKEILNEANDLEQNQFVGIYISPDLFWSFVKSMSLHQVAALWQAGGGVLHDTSNPWLLVCYCNHVKYYLSNGIFQKIKVHLMVFVTEIFYGDLFQLVWLFFWVIYFFLPSHLLKLSTMLLILEQDTVPSSDNFVKVLFHFNFTWLFSTNFILDLIVNFFLFFKIIEGKRLDIHFILDDAAGNSYIQVLLLC